MRFPPGAPWPGFDAAESSFRDDLARLSPLRHRYQTQIVGGGIHENAIDGRTLSLRATQKTRKGLTPPGSKPMRALHEARNHDRALRLIKRWRMERVGEWPITEEDLLEIRAAVLSDIDRHGRGDAAPVGN